jgi:Branched-chain amino acid transport protein (AzlD)
MTVWLTVGVLSLGTAVIKAAGPASGGLRRPSQRLSAVVALIAPAVLAALVVYETVRSGDGGLVVDARLPGLVAAAIALLGRLPLVAVIAVAAAVTALMRLVS